MVVLENTISTDCMIGHELRIQSCATRPYSQNSNTPRHVASNDAGELVGSGEDDHEEGGLA